MKKHFFVLLGWLFVACWLKKTRPENEVQSRIKREMISMMSKLPGRIVCLNVLEDDLVQKGNILAEIDISEVDSKLA
ncbi:MAG: biotin/lipoyl-binding protein [Flavobacteriales bacterium]